jgi:ABC-type sugar transport system ATPase subunit
MHDQEGAMPISDRIAVMSRGSAVHVDDGARIALHLAEHALSVHPASAA